MTVVARGPRVGSIGIMGGTFDPIHMGHLAVAEEARDSLGLERILFVPAGRPPHKPADGVTSSDDRVAMTALAIVDKDRKSTRLNSSHLKLSRMPSSA